MKKIIPIILIIVICVVLLFAGGLIPFKKNNVSNNTTNTTNMTNINLTNNTTADVKTNTNDYDSSGAKTDPNGAPSDVYSRWDTDGDGILSDSERDVHDRSLGQGNYYTGPENMKDSYTTYP